MVGVEKDIGWEIHVVYPQAPTTHHSRVRSANSIAHEFASLSGCSAGDFLHLVSSHCGLVSFSQMLDHFF